MDQTPDPSPASAEPAYTSGEPGGMSQSDERMWAMCCHLASLAKYTAIPLANILGPLLIWQIKKDQSPLVDDQGKEAVNFQISVTLYVLVGLLSLCVGIGFIVLPVLGIFDFVFTIIAAVKANQGEMYRYPLTIRFV
ncbi:MAG TPA: DUF4870 domain-containing protein [Pirellulales bacterium]